MRKLLLYSALLIAFQSHAQISFIDSTTTWEQLSKAAKKDKKLLFIHFWGSGCEQCNEVANQGFKSPGLQKIFQDNFIAISTDITSENGKKLAEKFQIRAPFVSLFADPEGNLLNRYNGTTNNAGTYLENAKLAIQRKSGKQLSDYEKEYQKGERSIVFLKEFIRKRREVNLPSGDLLDEYVGKLPVDSLADLQVIRFIFQQGPTLDSRAYKLIQAIGGSGKGNKRLVDSLYKSIPYQEAVAINRAIIANSMQKAVQTKDINLASQTAYFTQQTYSPDFNSGRLYYHRGLINFYYTIKDTTSYFRESNLFITNTHLRMTVDSLKRIDEAAFEKSRERQMPMGPGGPRQAVQFAPPSQHFHMELNEHAWHFYQLNNKTRDLEQALMWSKKSMEWYEDLRRDKNYMPLGNPAYIDTYAHLLYKLNRKSEAIEWQTKAVEAQKVTGQSWVSMEKDLEKMKAGTLKW